jgi:hypothetical protein
MRRLRQAASPEREAAGALLFTGYAFSDDAMIDAIETVLGDRYGFAAP